MKPPLTIMHTEGERGSEAIRLGVAEETLVLEAPRGIASWLDEQGARFATEGKSQRFRRSYYSSLSGLFRPTGLAASTGYSQEARSSVKAAALQTAFRTWTHAEMILELAGWSSPVTGRKAQFVTDNLSGLSLWTTLRTIAPSIGLGEVQLVDLRSEESTKARVAGRLDRALPGWRDKREHWGSLLRSVRGSRSSAAAVPTVVFLTDDFRNWKRLILIHDALLDQGVQVVAATTQPSVAHRVGALGIRASTVGPMRVSRALLHHVHEYLRTCPLNAAKLVRRPYERPISKTVDACLREMLVQRIGPGLLGRIAGVTRFVRVLGEAEGASACFAGIGNDHKATLSTMTREAHRLGLPAVLLAHGALDYTAPELRYYPEVDEFIAWGELMKQRLEDSSLPTSIEVVALGDPLMEDHLISESSDSNAMRETRSRSDGPPHVLVVFGRPSRWVARDTFDRAAREVMDAAANLLDWRFTIKVHPADRSRYWDGLVGDRRLPNVRVTATGDFYRMLPEVSAVVTMHSTAGAEAICAQKPVITVAIPGAEDTARGEPDYVSFGAAYVVRETGKLATTLIELDSHGPGSDPLAARRSAYSNAFLARGSRPAAERIAAHLAELAKSRRPVLATRA